MTTIKITTGQDAPPNSRAIDASSYDVIIVDNAITILDKSGKSLVTLKLFEAET